MSEINVNMNTQNHHLGLDCLRMVAMFFICIHHILTRNGVLSTEQWMSPRYIFCWFINIVVYCAVDAFALLSGYVGVQSGYTFKLSRLVRFWLRVAFYSISITILFVIFKPEALVPTASDSELKLGLWFNVVGRAILPIMGGQYWYATAYAAMCVFMPLMNVTIDKLERKQLEIFFALILIFFCFIPCLLQHYNIYGLANGFSVLWLCILYLFGGYIRHYNIPEKITQRKALCLFVLSATLIWGSKILIENTTFVLLGKISFGNTFYSYISPLLITEAVALLCFFANCEFKSNTMRKIVTSFAPTAFSVYLIHEHRLVWKHLLKNFAVYLASYNTLTMVLLVLAYAATIYISCSLIDIMRIKICRLFRRSWCQK